jgi:hypothetical protein
MARNELGCEKEDIMCEFKGQTFINPLPGYD